jgi:sn-glycerol 3-phosphate transport system substrate-binding protein
MRVLLCLFALLASLALAQARTVIPYWHSQDATEDVIAELAAAFNASQADYEVRPVYNGDYQESAIKLVAALGGTNVPVLFDAEGTVYARLIEEGALADLSALAAELPAELVADIYPAMWEYGEVAGRRYGLPWNMSMPVLFYNRSVAEQLGVAPPRTWADFEAAAAALTTRNTRGYIDVAAAFIFEALVSTRGGHLVTEDGRPNFDSPEAVDALSMLARMARARASVPRGFGELDQALVDFARTRAMMAIASQAFFPQGERFSVAFEVAAAPLPDFERGVPLVGAQMVVLGGASPQEQAGALAFWEFLMGPEQQRRWVEASYFLPTRRSVAEGMADWYAESPNRRAALEQLPYAVLRPRVGAYVVWQGYLQEALERVTKGGADPAAALAEAQRRALESR